MRIRDECFRLMLLRQKTKWPHYQQTHEHPQKGAHRHKYRIKPTRTAIPCVIGNACNRDMTLKETLNAKRIHIIRAVTLLLLGAAWIFLSSVELDGSIPNSDVLFKTFTLD